LTKRLPLPQQQILLTFLDFLLFQLESPGAWQDDPRNAEELIDDIYAARSVSSREYSL
jgi:hypothetical protein